MLETLKKYESQGLVFSQKHPALPLSIWNYSDRVQYEGLWDEITLQCRGLVIDENKDEVVARPFKKFFNLSENRFTPTEDFEVFDKMDGSLGILFYYFPAEKWIFASRGSFTSEQAIKGQQILKKYNLNMLFQYVTYCFEILYKENRIVIDYGDDEKLVMIGSFIIDGKEVVLDDWEGYGFDVVKKYDGIKDYKELKPLIKDNEEGFVVKFSNGDRVKIKGDEYLRLHRIMTAVSTTSIWECLKNGDDLMLLLKDVPDEFYNKVDDLLIDLKSQYTALEKEYLWIFRILSRGEDKKEFALNALKYKYSGILFNMYNNRDYSQVIWKAIKPKYQKI